MSIMESINVQKDIYGTYFDAVGNVVDQNAFQSSCGKSKRCNIEIFVFK